MGLFHDAGLLLLLLLLFLDASVSSSTSSVAVAPVINYNSSIAKPGCTDRCGNVNIPFPFGTTEDCYHSYSFFITCNQTSLPPKPYLQNSTIEITNITLDGQLTVLQFIAHDCYYPNHTRSSTNDPSIYLPISLTVNNTANKFTIVGCDTYGFVSGLRLNGNYQTGCTAICYAKDDLIQGACTGLGCCQTSIPKQVWRVELALKSYNNYSEVSDFNNCSYGFLVEETAFTFSPENLTNLKSVVSLPMVVDWAIGNGTCEDSQMNSSTYACRSVNSNCYKPDNGYGYRCFCHDGYHGNPYLFDGCKDIDECGNSYLNICEKGCKNTLGGFKCVCPKGYRGDGIKGAQGCIRSESLLFKLVSGIALGVIVVILGACWLHLELKRRRLIKMKQKFFLQNGGMLLQEKLASTRAIGSSSSSSDHTARIFSESELEKATNNFHTSMIVGQGGYGTVYKGFLSNNRVVAIKKSKQVDPNQIEQFINEMTVLSQINHRNVVKLIGCCLETQVPLLVYEFISNGTLFEHVHNKAKARGLSWDVRLRIAAETAGVLAYLHSSASTPIIHRDVKSANILLDHKLTAKVSDFGASRLVPLDEKQLSTMVQGTFGYLDPEYMQTNQLTEKSDVYSFGVVLVEVLTGKKALCYDRAEEDRSLANYFLSVMKGQKKESLFEIIVVGRDVDEGNVMRVGVLAKRCLNVRGEDRPTMKQVAMELEGILSLTSSVQQSSVNNDGDDEGWCVNGGADQGFSGFVNSTSRRSYSNSSSSVGFDSLRDHILPPVLGLGGGTTGTGTGR
ncbi:hypothetical protein ABFS83_14G319500 [Erythranthe nasuta]